MPTFDAGSAKGHITLDSSQFDATIRKTIVSAADINARLTEIATKTKPVSAAFVSAGMSSNEFAEKSKRSLSDVTTRVDQYVKSVNSATTATLRLKNQAADAAALAQRQAAAAASLAQRQSAALRLGALDVASPQVQSHFGVGTEVSVAVAGFAGLRQGAGAAAQEIQQVKAQLMSVAGQSAQTAASFAGLSNSAFLFSSVTNLGLLKNIANMIVLRREAHATAISLAESRAAGVLRLPAPASFVAESRAAALPAAMSTVKWGAAGIVTGAAGALALGVALKKTTSAAIDFEDSFAGVKKTIDGTDEEFARLKSEILDMSTRIPVAANTLNQIAESAGQLGIAKENISKFVDTIAKVGVATNMTEDEAATAFAQWANITQMPQQSIDRLASTVVRLGNETASTESQIAGMGLRLAGAGKVVGLTDAQIAGLSATLSSLGLQEEAAGTAFSTVMYEMASSVDMQNSKLKMFAALSGQSAKAFTDSFKNTPAKAIEDVVRGLEELRAAGGNVTQVLEALGLSDRRVRDAMIRISGSADFLKTNLGKAGDEWERNNALQVEAEKRFETTKSKSALLGNEMSKLAVNVGGVVIPAWKALLEVLGAVPMAINKAIDSIDKGDIWDEINRMREASKKHMADIKASGVWKPFDFDLSPEFKGRKTFFSSLLGTPTEEDRFYKRLADAQNAVKDFKFADVNLGNILAPPPDAVKVPLADPALFAMQNQKEEYVFGAKNQFDVLKSLVPQLYAVADGTQNATDKAAELQKVFAEIGTDKTPEQLQKMAEDMKGALPVEAIKSGLKDIMLVAEKLPQALSADVIAKNMGDLWKSNKEGAGSVEAVSAALGDIPAAYRAQFVAAAKAADAQEKATDASKKSASAAETEQKRLQDLGQQVCADLNQSAGAVDEVRKSLSGLAATGQITQENLAKLAQTEWGDIAAFPLDEQQKAIAGIAAVNQGLGAQIAILRDRDSALGSDFYRGLKDGPDIVGEVLKNVDDLKKSAVLHPDVYSLFGEGVWKQLTDVSGEALRGVYEQLDLLSKAAPNMAGFVDKVRAGMDAGLQKVRTDLGKEAWNGLNPQIEIGVKLKDDAANLQARIDDLAKGLGSKTLAVNVVPFFDARKLSESFLGTGPDVSQALENMFGKGDKSKSFIDGLMGHKSTVSRALLDRVKEAIDYAKAHLGEAGAQSVLLNWDTLLGLGSTGLESLVASVEMQIQRLNMGIEQPPSGIGMDAYIKSLEEALGLLNKILPAQKQVDKDADKNKRKTDEQNFGKTSSDMEGWAGAAENIASIGQGLDRLGPKFAKVQQIATATGDAIKLGLAVASGDPVSMAINGIALLGDALGLAGDKAEEMKTGMDRVFEEIGKSIEGWVDQFTDAIVEFVKTGKGSFKDLVDSILEDMLKLVIKYAIIQPILQSLGVSGSAFAKGNAFEGGNILPFAKGAAFAMPDMPKPYVPVANILPFAFGGAFAAGTVVNKATAFNMGVMGEAGPEAIMPLKRTADGSLGVRAIGGAAGVGGARIVVNNIDQSTRVTETQTETQMSTGSDGIITITNIMRDAVKRSLADGSLDRDMASNFGVKRRAR